MHIGVPEGSKSGRHCLTSEAACEDQEASLFHGMLQQREMREEDVLGGIFGAEFMVKLCPQIW